MLDQLHFRRKWPDDASSHTPNSDHFWMHLFLNDHSWIFGTPNTIILSINEAFNMKMGLVTKEDFVGKSPSNCRYSKSQFVAIEPIQLCTHEASNILLKFDAQWLWKHQFLELYTELMWLGFRFNICTYCSDILSSDQGECVFLFSLQQTKFAENSSLIFSQWRQLEHSDGSLLYAFCEL
ncbi:hypothetical protein D910_05619 [Dendroctonus ponderosae]|uniref:Uncharacterized protein n=1 Tax=Dendroctonus ponderosae TaxID=77166 RepID=U4UCA2_DENPD|nr:hypothetical protein D910_05619 [Dendroctonus ponderosae]